MEAELRAQLSMKAAVFYGPGDLRLEEVPIPVISDREILVEVEACAICGSDLRTYRHGARNITHPVIMGHEVTGTIVEVGRALRGERGNGSAPDAGRGFFKGQRVAVAPAIPCEECSYCQRGIQTMCDHLRSIGYEFDGGFARYLLVPYSAVKAGCLNPIPPNLSFVDATLAEPLACAINAQELLETGMDDTVAIVGAGPLGCLHADLAKIRGARRVIQIDLREERLKLAERFGADVFINGAHEDVESRVLQETGGGGASVVIVAAPSAQAQELAVRLAAKHGRVDFFGGLPKSQPFINLNANLVHYRELFIMGAYGSKPRQNRLALELLAAGRIHASALIGMVVGLEEIKPALEAVSQGKILKAVVQP